MLKKQHNGLSWLQFEHLTKEGVVHALFTREGGFSAAPFDSLNFGFNCGDNEDHVRQNRAKAISCLNLTRVASCFQVHGDELFEAKEGFRPYADGLFTQERGLGLMTLYADCQAVLFYDPKKQAIASLHSGWRGSCANIIGKGIQALEKRYGCKPKDLLVGVSPSLSPAVAEFIHWQHEIPQELWAFRTDEHHFDFWAITRHQLLHAGVDEEKIEFAKVCTYKNDKEYFSFRRDQKVTGRHASLIALKA